MVTRMLFLETFADVECFFKILGTRFHSVVAQLFMMVAEVSEAEALQTRKHSEGADINGNQ